MLKGLVKYFLITVQMRKYFSEFLGTLFFLFVILATRDPLAIAVALALVIVLLGPISGAHVNPAVTFMMFANKELAKSDLLPYVLAQIAGGLAAIQLHKAIVN